MTVGSTLEMYVTHFGWIGFNLIMAILLSTYLIFIPLVGGLASAWFDGIRNTDTRPGVLSSLRRIELRLLSFVVVFFLCAVPVIPLEMDELSVIPQNAGHHINTPETTHSVTDDPSTLNGPMMESLTALQSSLGGTPKVPVFWMLVMQLSSGITYAAASAVPEVFDLRATQVALGQFAFHDQSLSSELNEFVNDCYRVARGKYDLWSTSGQFDRVAPLATRTALAANPDMVNWIGSPVFRQTPGLYAQCTDIDLCGSSPQSGEPVSSWPYVEERDGPRESTYELNDPGHPRCQEWWEHDQRGLRSRILTSSTEPGPLGAGTILKRYVGLLFDTVSMRGDLAMAEDVAVERAIEKSRSTAAHRSHPLYGANDSANRYSDHGFVREVVGGIGALWGSGKAVTQSMLIKNASYVLQGSLLFIVYALMPFVLLFTSMSPKTMLTGGLFIFGIKFLTVLWAFAHFLETTLHQGLFPGWPDVEFTEVYLDFATKAESEAIYNMVTVLMYVAFPLLWLTVLGFAGVELSRGLANSFSTTSSATSNAANTGVGVAKSAAFGAKGKIKS